MSSKREAIEQLLGRQKGHAPIHTGIQEPVDKKKATFDLDPVLHRELKLYAASRGRHMVEIVEQAVREYMERNR